LKEVNKTTTAVVFFIEIRGSVFKGKNLSSVDLIEWSCGASPSGVIGGPIGHLLKKTKKMSDGKV